MSFSYRSIACSVGKSKSWVGRLIMKYQKSGISFEDARQMTRPQLLEAIDHSSGDGERPDMDNKKTQRELEPSSTKEASQSLLVANLAEIPSSSTDADTEPAEDDGDIWTSMTKIRIMGEKPTRKYLYDNYYFPAEANPLGYSQFCRNYNKCTEAEGKKAIMYQEQLPGHTLFIDWVGDTVTVMFRSGPEEPVVVYFFLTVLGVGSYAFCEGFLSMDQNSWNQGNLDALDFYGGVPYVVTPDNTKTAVIHRKLYDTELNHAYLDMAWKYRFSIQPARVRKPRDKAAVESGVNYIEKNLLMDIKRTLEEDGFDTLADLNAKIRELMETKYNVAPFQKRKGSRKSLFEEIDKPALQPLPKDRMELFETVKVKSIPRNYLVGYDGFSYSVPFRYIGKEAYIHAYKNHIEVVLEETRELIAFHPRHFEGSPVIMKLEHMPENHRAFYEFQHTSAEDYREKAMQRGKHVHTFICDLLQAGPTESQMYKECMGILKLGEKYGSAKLNSACRKALEAYSVSYTTVETILKGGTDGSNGGKHGTDECRDDVSDHENIRKDWM